MSNKVGPYSGDNGYTFDDGVYDSVSFNKVCDGEDGDDVSYLDFEYANERNQSRTLSHSSRPQKLKEVSYQPLNLHLTQSPEFMKSIDEYYLQQHKKLKAINFPVSKITIGQWTRVAIYPDDIVAKFYFAKKKLIWEFLDLEEPQSNRTRLKRKIEIQWDDVSSLREKFHACDNTGIFEVELRKPPTFFIETNPQAGKHTQWKQMDQDFTQNQSSICRRHKLHFQPGILQKNLEKLVSSNSFWSELMKVTFPLHESIYFDIGYGSNNNNNNSLTYNHGQILSFNDANLQHHSQGTDCLGLEEGNFHMATHFWDNGGMQINSYGDANVWNNTPNELRVMEDISSSSQVINKDYNMLSGSQINNLMNQYESGMQNMNEIPMYPQVGSYLANIVFQDVQDLI